MDAAVRRRSRQRIASLALLPVAGALAAWPQLALGALVGAAGTVAVMSALSTVPSQPGPGPTSSAGGGLPHTSTGSAGRAPRAALPAPASEHTDSSGDSKPTPAGSTQRPFVGNKPVASDSPTPPVEGLQQEIELLEEARRKLAPDPTQARRLLLEHERRFAGGQLRIEREFLLIDALVRLGRRPEAEARARVLEGQAPKSLYGQRLEQILGRSGSTKKKQDL
jgi:hypothetical protein